MASVTPLAGPRVQVLTFCAEDDCVNEVVSGRCDEHKREVKRPAGQYDRHWRIRRAAYLKKHPVCEKAGCGEASVDVHHVHGEGPAGGNRDEDLEALCKSHHSRITASARWSKRDRPVTGERGRTGGRST